MIKHEELRLPIDPQFDHYPFGVGSHRCFSQPKIGADVTRAFALKDPRHDSLFRPIQTERGCNTVCSPNLVTKECRGIDLTRAVVVGTTEVPARRFSTAEPSDQCRMLLLAGLFPKPAVEPDNRPRLHPRIKSETRFAETALTAAGRRNPR